MSRADNRCTHNYSCPRTLGKWLKTLFLNYLYLNVGRRTSRCNGQKNPIGCWASAQTRSVTGCCDLIITWNGYRYRFCWFGLQIRKSGDITTALQRIGRAGHHVGGIPSGFLPSSVDDLIDLQHCRLLSKLGIWIALISLKIVSLLQHNLWLGWSSLTILISMRLTSNRQCLVLSKFRVWWLHWVLDMLEENVEYGLTGENLYGKRIFSYDLLHQHRHDCTR